MTDNSDIFFDLIRDIQPVRVSRVLNMFEKGVSQNKISIHIKGSFDFRFINAIMPHTQVIKLLRDLNFNSSEFNIKEDKDYSWYRRALQESIAVLLLEDRIRTINLVKENLEEFYNPLRSGSVIFDKFMNKIICKVNVGEDKVKFVVSSAGRLNFTIMSKIIKDNKELNADVIEEFEKYGFYITRKEYNVNEF